jgi:GWxTD domain-containing protein
VCALGLSLPALGGPAPQQQDGPPAQPTAAAKKKSDRKLLKELDNQYREWLEEDVAYIITPEERKAFLQLSTNEEREEFIEQFWQRRNPNPESPDNTFKEEHYRRIAYANQHFASGWPGWRTDRGRIYIVWGPPDQIDARPSGGPYQRTPDEGGGYTTVYPFEDWRYHYLEGIGNDITLEFVDTTMTGDYHLTLDPCEKDAMAKVGNAGPTDLEMNGMTNKSTRSMGQDLSTCGPTQIGTQMVTTEFDRLRQFHQVNAGPPTKFPDLQALVTTKVLRNQITFDYRVDFLRVTSDTVLVPITVDIPNRQLSFESKAGVNSAVLDVFGRVSTLSGRVVQTFEDTINRDIPDALLRQSLEGRSLYQKAVPLRPGLYRLDIVVKDTQSGNVGTLYSRLVVPHFSEEKLSTSTLILADQLSRVPMKQIGLGQFVIGGSKVRPRMDRTFFANEPLGIYLQIYNLGIDEKTQKSDANVTYLIYREESGADPRLLYRSVESSASLNQMGQQMTLEKLLLLNKFAPGRYKLTLQINDNLTKQSLLTASEFTVKAPPVAAARN